MCKNTIAWQDYDSSCKILEDLFEVTAFSESDAKNLFEVFYMCPVPVDDMDLKNYHKLLGYILNEVPKDFLNNVLDAFIETFNSTALAEVLKFYQSKELVSYAMHNIPYYNKEMLDMLSSIELKLSGEDTHIQSSYEII